MALKEGYLKSNNVSDTILSCSNMPKNCNGDEKKGYCTEGHIGPLCESCDVDGKIWGDKYATDGNYNCTKCIILKKAKYIIPTIILVITMIFSIVISLRIAL